MSELVIPVDVSQVTDKERAQQRVKVAVQQGDKVTSQVVEVAAGKAEVRLNVDPKLPLTVAAGPESVADEDIFKLQTITSTVSPAQWAGKQSLSVQPILVTPAWWRLWLSWCRTFVITGRVVCADGSPVPGAEVRAYDVDFFWWWSSIIQAGPTVVTDANGHFAIKFRWCCGWWPWWWWRLRSWRLEPALIDKIYPILKLNPALRFREPDPTPTIDIFSQSAIHFPLSQNPTGGYGPTNVSPPQITQPQLAQANPVSAAFVNASRIEDPSIIAASREKLLAALPRVPEMERLRIWPWWPWTPWLDCTPDIIFRVTQNCGGGQTKVIVNENIFQTRWDIPTNLDVTLVANDQACCVPREPPPPEGDCVVITDVCGVQVNNIGGNAGAPAPVGYANPGGRDRPFSEVINLSGQFGSSAQADYYEIESSPHAANAWSPVPPAALLDIVRGYFDSTQVFPNQWFYPGFPVKSFGALHVYESRHHYEVTHPPANWGTAFGRTWTINRDLIASIQTFGNFSDGAYDFRVIGYKALANGDPDPASRKVMDGCGGQQNNLVVIRLDNRIVGPPTPNSIHVNTDEPDCGILAVRLGGSLVAPCGAQQLQPGTPLEIDFSVTDNPVPIGHLDHYTLYVKYDTSTIKNLLSAADVGAFSLTPISGGPAGPDYSQAVAQGAVRPDWHGGTLRLHINDASQVFRKTCCYLLELTVYKRNIVNCNGNLAYYNQTHYTFTITV